MPQVKIPLSVFGTEVAVPVVRSNKYSLLSSLLNRDTSAGSLHPKKIE
jgi:ABC-type taurine transport system substrate-binding protein